MAEAAPGCATPPDVLVIGGGITGGTAAIALAEAGARVAVLDAGLPAGSAANAGSLHVQLQSRFLRLFPELAPNVEASLPLYVQAVREWEALARRLGGFDLVRAGGLMLAGSAAQMRFLEAKAAREAARGVAVELLDRAGLERIAPWAGPGIVGAELCRDEGKLDPLLANRRLAEHAAALGVVRLSGRAVALTADPAAILADGRRLAAGQILLAAAWGSGAMTASLGCPLPSRAEPLHMNITEPAAPAIGQLIQHAERPITLKQLGTGQIVIGGGWPALAAEPVPRVHPGSLLGNVALAGEIAPALGTLRVIRCWAGYNTTLDGRTALGRLPRAGRVIVAIPGDAGYTLGPLVGRAAAALALGTPPPFDVAPCDPARFWS
ncbi:MAG: D-amino-acid oxidase [Paracoccaceae bacterium]|nr:MAG: D-amino-acid oxidase [Paracoccaceae bacterium]